MLGEVIDARRQNGLHGSRHIQAFGRLYEPIATGGYTEHRGNPVAARLHPGAVVTANRRLPPQFRSGLLLTKTSAA